MADKRIPLVWDFLRNPPQTAIRWPSLDEVTGKPDHYPTKWGLVDGVPVYAQRWPSFAEVTGKPTYYPSSWSNVAGKPAQSLRWPTFAEVTNRPATYPADWDGVANKPETATRWPTRAEIGAKSSYYSRDFWFSTGGGEHYAKLCDLHSGADDSDGYLYFEIHKKDDHGNATHQGLIMGWLNQRRGDWDAQAYRLGRDDSQPVAIKLIQNGGVLEVWAWASDYCMSVIRVAQVSASGQLPEDGAVLATQSVAPAGVELWSSHNSAGTIYHSADPTALASKAVAGYWKDKQTGLIYQWGLAWGSAATDKTTTFPIAFPNSCLNVQVTAPYNLAVKNYYKSASKTGITVTGLGTAQAVHYFAVGY